MRNIWLFIFGLIPITLNAQISVYNCNALNALVYQADIDAASYEYHRTCLLFGENENYLFDQNDNKKVTATSQIHIEQRNGTEFQSGEFDQSGSFWMKLEDPEPKYDIVLLNDNNADLNNIGRYKKLELGIELTGQLLDRINKFTGNTNNVDVGNNCSFIDPAVDPNAINCLNPFLDWELDINVKFTHLQTGIVKWRDAFFFQDYNRSNNDWIPTSSNPYPMRIRFAPPENGIWKAEVEIKYRDNADNNTSPVFINYVNEVLPEFYFNVVETGDPGFVKKHPNNRNFLRGDKLIFPVGHNLAGPTNGVDVYGEYGMQEDETNKAAKLDDWMSFHQDVKDYVEQGGKYIKFLQLASSSLIEFEILGNYYNRMHYAFETDSILEYCEKNNVLIHFNLLFQESLMRYGQYGTSIWDFGHYKKDQSIDYSDDWGPYCYYVDQKEPYMMFTSDDNVDPNHPDMEYHKQRMRYYIARYGYSPNIYQFELLSEPWWLNSTFINDSTVITPWKNPSDALHSTVKTALKNYHETMANYIKDELMHKDHLIGITIFSDAANYPWNTIDETSYPTPVNVFLDKSVEVPNIDVIGLNKYALGPKKLIKATKTDNNNSTPLNEHSYYQMVKQLHDSTDKIVVYSEVGSPGSCNSLLTHTIDVMTLGFTGVGGFYMWAGYSHPSPEFPTQIDETNLWEWTIRAQNHMDGYDVTDVLDNSGGDWIQGRQVNRIRNWIEDPGKELQYYLAQDKLSGVGYIRNRTYNSYTLNTLASCDLQYSPPYNSIYWLYWNQGKKLNIEGVIPFLDYDFDWFNIINGYMWSTSDNANFWGKLKKFPHPDMGYDVLWFNFYVSNSQRVSNDDIDSLSVETLERKLPSFSPNPFNDKIEVFSSENLTIIIFDIRGTVIKICTIRSGTNSIDLSEVESGLYIVKSNNGEYLGKIIKQ